jgi:hypothetical protein
MTECTTQVAIEFATKVKTDAPWSTTPTEPSAFASMLGGLIDANVRSNAAKEQDFDSLVARVGIWVTDIDEGVTLDFKGGKLTVHNGLKPRSTITIRTDAETVMSLSNLKIGFLGLPVYYDEVGRESRREAGARQAQDRRPAAEHPDLECGDANLFCSVTVLGVVGAGSMGAQIAQQAALNGIDVTLQDTSAEQLAKAAESNRGHVMRRVEKGRLAQVDADAALARVRTTTDLGEAVGKADVVIEAVFEDLDVKRAIFAGIDRLAPAEAVLASNSSTMGISKIAGATSRPESCVNMHFFYPVLVMTSSVVRNPYVWKAVGAPWAWLGEGERRSSTGDRRFIVNRILHAATQEAYRWMPALPFGTWTPPSRKAQLADGAIPLGDFSGLT